MVVDCKEHRKMMELLALRQRLEKENEDKQRKILANRIAELESELHIN